MGMYDEIVCNYPLPDEEFQGKTFQTKSLDAMMDEYTITADGKLIKHDYDWAVVPEEERPYYGTEEWDEKEFLRWAGSMRREPRGDIVVPHHGDIRFYNFFDDVWYEYIARFTNGELESIRRVQNDS
jgi:hypothetical protein